MINLAKIFYFHPFDPKTMIDRLQNNNIIIIIILFRNIIKVVSIGYSADHATIGQLGRLIIIISSIINYRSQEVAAVIPTTWHPESPRHR